MSGLPNKVSVQKIMTSKISCAILFVGKIIMKNEYEIKYCQKCKKDVAVVDYGNINGKHRYMCKVCGRQITERKYPIEVRNLAVKFYSSFGYSYRKIARIFGIEKSPNTIRNWVLEKPEYDINYEQQIEILNEYKAICDNIEILLQCEKALEYRKFEKWLKALDDAFLEPNPSASKLRKIEIEKDYVYAEKKKLGEVKYKKYSYEKLRELQSTVNKPIEELEADKIELESKSVFLRDKYDIPEIIRLMKRLAKKD